jgi:hypothetical protein
MEPTKKIIYGLSGSFTMNLFDINIDPVGDLVGTLPTVPDPNRFKLKDSKIEVTADPMTPQLWRRFKVQAKILSLTPGYYKRSFHVNLRGIIVATREKQLSKLGYP